MSAENVVLQLGSLGEQVLIDGTRQRGPAATDRRVAACNACNGTVCVDRVSGAGVASVVFRSVWNLSVN